MRTLIIDNYDSFTYNLAHYLAEINGCEPTVVHNDEPGWTVDDLNAFDNVVVSPGPGHPGREADFGFSREAVLHSPIPLLGVCLGHQSIGAALGGRIVRAQRQMHGKASTLTTDGEGVYAGLPREFSVIRYHSLAIEPETCPAELVVTSRSEDGEIMGVRHRELAGTRTPLEGVQFHPESILSEHGHAMLRNFLNLSQIQ